MMYFPGGYSSYRSEGLGAGLGSLGRQGRRGSRREPDPDSGDSAISDLGKRAEIK